MTYRYLFNIFRVLLGFFLAASAVASDISPALESNLKKRIELNKNPGFIIGIVDKDGYRYYGIGETKVGSGVKPDKDAVYEIGSITKTFTAILLADMALKGEVKLDDPVQKYLPSTVTMPQRNGKQITLEHLSTHHSSLPRLPGNLEPKNQMNPYADYTIAQMYDFLSDYTLTRDIDSLGEYSNLGVGLLGHTLSLANETDYESLVKDRLLIPLSMNETAITLDDRLEKLLAPPYISLNNHLGPAQNWNNPTLAGAGDFRSNAKDLLKFLAANIGLDDTPLRFSMELSHQIRREFGNAKIGLGWIIRGEDDDAIIWHNGGTGGYRTFVGFSKAKQKGVVVLTNSTTSPDDIGFHLLNASLPLTEYKERVEISLDKQILEQYAGKYQLTPDFAIEITVAEDKIYAQATDQPRIEIFPEAQDEFFYKIIDAQITFEKDTAGAVTALTLHQGGQNIPGKKIE